MAKNAKVVVGPNFLAHWYIYDFQVCEGRPELLRTMDYINRHGYDLISVNRSATATSRRASAAQIPPGSRSFRETVPDSIFGSRSTSCEVT